jgi:Na+-translocating ferredoxin:NAD+ oxidoreductase RnfG subunit
MSYRRWMLLPILATTTSVYATTYFTVEQVQQVIFPGEKMAPSFLTLTDQQAKQIETLTHAPIPSKEIKAWKSTSGGWIIVDDVIGKHETITYAVGIQPDGNVKQIEIMTYRESYGYEIRNAEWRKQFSGKNAHQVDKLSDEIRNISGATLSSRHVTEGVKRVLLLHSLFLSHKG